ncbi:MAG TPA: hypothetical protein VK662_13910 [Acidothermaceae bacterium]|nr:hypothetical protein [Acidothermaceae bacterium]
MKKQPSYRSPPNWPTPPAGWVPPSGWAPDPAWGPAPPGWSFWAAPPRRHRLLMAVIAVVVLVGIGITSTVLFTGKTAHEPSASGVAGGDTVHRSGGTPNEWLSSGASYVLFIDWTRVGNDVSGNMSVAGAEESQFGAQTVAMSGTISGNSITLTFPAGLGAITNATGELTAVSLTLNLPNNDGTIDAYEFTPGTIDAYNVAVQALQSGASATAQAQIEASASAAQLASQQAVIAATDNTIAKAAAALINADAALEKDPAAAQNDVQALPAVRATQQRDLASTAAAQRAVIAEAAQYPDGNNGQVCSDAYEVTSDAYQVTSDDYQVTSTEYTINADLDTIRSDQAAVTQAAQDYKNAQSYDPAFLPNTAPPGDAVLAADQTAAMKVITQVTAAETAATAASAQAITQANADADAANKAGC